MMSERGLPVFALVAIASWAACATISLAADAANPVHPAKYVIWKLDDLRAGPVNGVAAGFNRVAEWCKEKGMKASIGIIGNSLEKPSPAYIAWIKAHAIENGGLIEFWNHGLDHSRNPVGNAACEFKGTDLAFQLDHLTKANRFMKEATGITFHTFGSPFNQSDATTDQAISQIPEFNVWLYGPKSMGKDMRQPLVLKRMLNLEYETGKVSAEKFLESYPKVQAEPYLVLQGHSGAWDEDSFKNFTTIANRLVADGWSFITPYAYFQTVSLSPAVKK